MLKNNNTVVQAVFYYCMILVPDNQLLFPCSFNSVVHAAVVPQSWAVAQETEGLDVSEEKCPASGGDLERESTPERAQVCQALMSSQRGMVVDQESTSWRRAGKIPESRVGTGVVCKVQALDRYTGIVNHTVQWQFHWSFRWSWCMWVVERAAHCHFPGTWEFIVPVELCVCFRVVHEERGQI